MPVGDEVMDADLSGAMEKIMGKIAPEDVMTSAELERQPRRAPPRQEGEEIDARQRDVNEREAIGDLEVAEREAAEAEGGEDDSGEGPQAGEADEQFIELEAAGEGEEAERIPLAQAVEQLKAYRQIQGDIATAVIRAEDEARGEQQKVTDGLRETFKAVYEQGITSLRMMQAYMPQEPDPIMLDENSGYYDPAAYHKAKLYRDGYVQHYRQVEAEVKRAAKGVEVVDGHADKATLQREMERAARYIPEFKDAATRKAKTEEILGVLGPRYGVTAQDLEAFGDHRAWRIVNDLAGLLAKQKAAPEVRKHVQEKAPKLVNGRPAATNRDQQTGRFVSEARKALKESGSEDAMARYLLQSGALKGF